MWISLKGFSVFLLNCFIGKLRNFRCKILFHVMHKEVLKKSLETLDQTPKHCRVHVGELKLEKSLQDICKLATQHCMCARAWDRGTDSTQGYYRLGQVRLECLLIAVNGLWVRVQLEVKIFVKAQCNKSFFFETQRKITVR